MSDSINQELIRALADMVEQHCYRIAEVSTTRRPRNRRPVEATCVYQTGCLRADANAMRLLIELGVMRLIGEDDGSRTLRAVFIDFPGEGRF